MITPLFTLIFLVPMIMIAGYFIWGQLKSLLNDGNQNEAGLEANTLIR